MQSNFDNRRYFIDTFFIKCKNIKYYECFSSIDNLRLTLSGFDDGRGNTYTYAYISHMTFFYDDNINIITTIIVIVDRTSEYSLLPVRRVNFHRVSLNPTVDGALYTVLEILSLLYYYLNTVKGTLVV